MYFKINSFIGFLVSILFVAGFLLGVPIADLVSNILSPGYHEEVPLKFELIENARLMLLNSGEIIAGLWLFFNSRKYNQHRITWLLLGFSFGLIAIILFITIVIYEDMKENLNQINFPSFKSLIVILIFFVILKMSNVLIDPWMVHHTNAGEYVTLTLYGRSIDLFFITLDILTKILLLFSVISYLKNKDNSPWFWGISCLVIGCFPIILKVLMLIVNRLKKNVV